MISTRAGCDDKEGDNNGWGGRRESTGTKTKFKHMKIKYPFQARSWIRVGVIMTTKKFQIQFAEVLIA